MLRQIRMIMKMREDSKDSKIRLIDQDQDMVLEHLYDAAVDLEELLFSGIVLYLYLAFGKYRDKWGMVVQDLERAIDTRQLHEANFGAVQSFFRCNNL